MFNPGLYFQTLDLTKTKVLLNIGLESFVFRANITSMPQTPGLILKTYLKPWVLLSLGRFFVIPAKILGRKDYSNLFPDSMVVI